MRRDVITGGFDIAVRMEVQPKKSANALTLFKIERRLKASKVSACLAVVPAFLAEEGINSGAVQNLLPEWKLDPISVFATWPSNAPKNGLINLLRSLISVGMGFKSYANVLRSSKRMGTCSNIWTYANGMKPVGPTVQQTAVFTVVKSNGCIVTYIQFESAAWRRR